MVTYVIAEHNRGLFNTFIKDPAEEIFDKLEKRGKNWIVSMFEDNSGVVQYNKKYMFCIKFETHNSPSNKEPVQGAKTGIDGVNRDIFGTLLGTFDAIANFFFYCTGDPIYKGWLPEGVKHPYVLLKGITQGVREGGNECQIPTLGGGLITDPRYIAKCLVYCGTVGWSPVESEDGKSYLRINPRVGDLIFVAGQPVGIDDKKDIIDGSNVKKGDVIVGIATDGLMTNGYTLARRLCNEITELNKESLKEELSRPHRYFTDVLFGYENIEGILTKFRGKVKGMAHITGGGQDGNIIRMIPSGLIACLSKDVLPVPRIMNLFGNHGVSQDELYRTFNMGVGFTLTVSNNCSKEITNYINKNFRYSIKGVDRKAAQIGEII